LVTAEPALTLSLVVAVTDPSSAMVKNHATAWRLSAARGPPGIHNLWIERVYDGRPIGYNYRQS
jgi:hypothetical protein